MGLDPVTGTLLAISATSTAVGYQQQRQAQQRQEEASNISQAQQRSEAARRRRMAARRARIRRAQVQQAAVNTGVGGSSGTVAAGSAASRGISEQSSRLWGNQVAASAISRSNQKAAESSLRGSIASSIGQMTGQMAFNPAAKAGISDMFSTAEGNQPRVDTRRLGDL